MGYLAGKTVFITWILGPDEDYLKDNRPELNHMLSIAYNLCEVAKGYQAMPIMRWAWSCNHGLADYRRHHYPHFLESAGNYR